MKFPENFKWGVACAAIQVEGYPREDGGGESIWEAFCKQEGKVHNGDDISIACDAYHRYEEDIRLAAELGVSVYRFSISWSRVDPLGDGRFNEKGLDYYSRVLDCILSYGLEPYVTLYHWELPQALEERGGWAAPGAPEAFAAYARRIAELFRGRVHNYITFNEPQCIIGHGNVTGKHAPGNHYENDKLVPLWKGVLLSHGLAMRALKEVDPTLRVGLVSCGDLAYPSTDSPADIEAARKATFSLTDAPIKWTFSHTLVFDPVCLGTFGLPTDFTDEEWRIIHCPPDFLGVNVYKGEEVKAGPDGEPEYVPLYRGYPKTAIRWAITPRVMNHSVRFFWDRYNIPIIITEDGCSCNDRVYADGKVHDADRIDFLRRYLTELSKCAGSAHVEGYFHWSITDNFEWSDGYSERFGLVYIDYPTLKRIPKDSYYWYKEIVRHNGEEDVSDGQN